MRVQLILEAIDRASAPIRAARAALSGFTGATKQLATVERVNAAQQRASQAQAAAQSNLLGAVGTAAAVFAPMRRAVQEFNAYQDALTDVGLKSDLSGVKLQQLGERVRTQARALNTSSTDLLRGMNTLMEGGLSASDAEGALVAVTKAAIATKTPITDLGQLTVAMINNGKIAAGDVGRGLSILAQAGKDGNAELNKMVSYLPQLTSLLSAMGRTGLDAVADIGAAFQVVNGVVNNMQGSHAGIRDMLNKITSDKAVKAFSGAGIDIVAVMKEATAAGRPFDAILESLQNFTGGDLTKIKEVFGDVQAQNAARALLQNLKEFEEIRKRARNAGDVIGNDFAARMGLGVEKTRALGVAFNELWTTLGAALAPTVNAGVDKIIDIVWAIEGWVKANPELAAGIAQAAMAVTGLFVAMAAVKLVMAVFRTGLVGLLGAFFKFNEAGKNVSLFARLGRVLMALLAPVRILWAVLSGLMSGLVGGIGSAVAAFGGWGAVGAAVFGRLAGFARLLFSPLMLVARAFMMIGAAMMATPIGWIIAGIAAIAAAAYLIYQNWGAIGPWLSGLWASITGALQAAWSGIVSWLGSLGQGILGALQSAWSTVTGWFSGLQWPALPSFVTVIGDLFAPVVSALQTSWSAVATWFGGIQWPPIPDPLAAIKAVLEPAWQWISGWVTKVTSTIAPLQKVFGFFSRSSGPALAAGLAAATPAPAAMPITPPGIVQTQPAFAQAAPSPGGGGGVTGSTSISVNLTLAPDITAPTGEGFVRELRAALPSIGHELAQIIQNELAKRERTTH